MLRVNAVAVWLLLILLWRPAGASYSANGWWHGEWLGAGAAYVNALSPRWYGELAGPSIAGGFRPPFGFGAGIGTVEIRSGIGQQFDYHFLPTSVYWVPLLFPNARGRALPVWYLTGTGSVVMGQKVENGSSSAEYRGWTVKLATGIALDLRTALLSVEGGHIRNRRTGKVYSSSYFAGGRLGLGAWRGTKVKRVYRTQPQPSLRLAVGYSRPDTILRAGVNEYLDVKVLNDGKGLAANVFLRVVATREEPDGAVWTDTTWQELGNLKGGHSFEQRFAVMPGPDLDSGMVTLRAECRHSSKTGAARTVTGSIDVMARPHPGRIPPRLAIDTLDFDDSTGNRNSALDAGEAAVLLVAVSNSGTTTARHVHVTLSTAAGSGIQYQAKDSIDELPQGQKRVLRFALTAAESVTDGTAEFRVDVTDRRFSAASAAKVIRFVVRRGEQTPVLLAVTDQLVTSGEIVRGETAAVAIDVMNKGGEAALDVRVRVESPVGVRVIGSTQTFILGRIEPGATSTIDFSLAVDDPPTETVTLLVEITEASHAADRVEEVSLPLDE